MMPWKIVLLFCGLLLPRIPLLAAECRTHLDCRWEETCQEGRCTDECFSSTDMCSAACGGVCLRLDCRGEVTNRWHTPECPPPAPPSWYGTPSHTSPPFTPGGVTSPVPVTPASFQQFLIDRFKVRRLSDGRTLDGRQRLVLTQPGGGNAIAWGSRYLQQQGFRVVTVNSADDAARAIHDHQALSGGSRPVSVVFLGHGSPGKIETMGMSRKGTVPQVTAQFGDKVRGKVSDVFLCSCETATGADRGDQSHLMQCLSSNLSTPQQKVPVGGITTPIWVYRQGGLDARGGDFISVTPK